MKAGGVRPPHHVDKQGRSK